MPPVPFVGSKEYLSRIDNLVARPIRDLTKLDLCGIPSGQMKVVISLAERLELSNQKATSLIVKMDLELAAV
jgi:hypothetical protein